VARRNREQVPGLQHALGAVGHQDRGAAAHHQAEVLDLAEVGPGGGADVLCPPPSRLIARPTDRDSSDPEELEAAPRELAGLLRVA
jgi:hypothetical protein